MAPALGRTFDPTLDVDFPAREAVLSHGVWADALGGDPNAVGRTFRVDDLTYEIVGVMPAGFAFPRPLEAAMSSSPTTPGSPCDERPT